MAMASDPSVEAALEATEEDVRSVDSSLDLGPEKGEPPVTSEEALQRWASKVAQYGDIQWNKKHVRPRTIIGFSLRPMTSLL